MSKKNNSFNEQFLKSILKAFFTLRSKTPNTQQALFFPFLNKPDLKTKTIIRIRYLLIGLKKK